MEKKENNGKLDPATKKAKKPSAFVRKARASLPPFGRFAQPGRHRASQLLGTTPPVPKRLFIYDLFQRRARTSDRGYFHRLSNMPPKMRDVWVWVFGDGTTLRELRFGRESGVETAGP